MENLKSGSWRLRPNHATRTELNQGDTGTKFRSGNCCGRAGGRRCQTGGMSKPKRKRTSKTVLRLPDLEHSKSAVLNSLASQSSQRSYDHAIREFIEWYCSEPRLAFNKTVVIRYRIFLEQAHYASSTINLRLAAVRRLAYEASDAGLLSPDLAAGIRRVKGAMEAWHSDGQLANRRTSKTNA